MTDQESQQGNEAVSNQDEKKEQGGYLRSLHKLEEKLYSPELNISGIAMKVLLYIRHETLRWDNENCAISFSDIAIRTGISERRAKEAVKVLETNKLIIVMRRTIGKRVLPNIVGLNPEYFGELVEPTCRPKLSIVQGGKVGKLSTGVRKTAPLFTENRTPPYVNPHPSQGLDEPPEPKPSSLKNPLKEHSKITQQEEVELNGSVWDKAKAGILKSFPGDEAKLNQAYGQICQTQTYHTSNRPIYNPVGFLVSCWESIRKDFAWVDDVEKSRTHHVKELEKLDPAAQRASDKARDESMARFSQGRVLRVMP